MDEVILSRIRQEAYEQGYQDGKVDGYNLAGTRMSSAKQERKKGKWIVIMDEPTITFDECKCSVCGVVEYFNKGWKKFSYCPNCGAEMSKGEE